MRYVKIKLVSCSILAVLLLFISPSVHAKTTPQEVSKKLIVAFALSGSKENPTTKIVKKDYVGMKMQTVLFSLGSKMYRVVFSSDDSVVVSLTHPGEVASQPVYKSSAKNATVEEIVNAIYSREFGRTYDSTLARKAPSRNPTDNAPKVIAHRDTSSNDLRWDGLMNRVLKGDTASFQSQGNGNASRGFEAATQMAKMMRPCGQGRSGSLASQSQRAVVSDIAQVMIASADTPKSSSNEELVDRSREYGKNKDYSFLNDLNQHDQKKDRSNGEAFRLIQQSRSDAYEIFRRALENSDVDAKDPYAMAALRNFKPIAKGITLEDGKKLVDSVLAKTVVDVDAFTHFRKTSPKAEVIYDREGDRFFIDPTLNSPAEARYLLSLATLYAWQFNQPETRSLLQKYEETEQLVSQIESAILDEKDVAELANKRTELDALSSDLFALAERLRKTTARPHS